MGRHATKLLILLLVATGLVAAVWFSRTEWLPPIEEPAVIPEAASADQAPARVGPIHPLAPRDPSELADETLVPLPPLDDSDSYFLLALVDIFGAGIEPVLVNEALIDRFVATVDNLPRDHVAEKVRPAKSLPSAFVANTTGADGDALLGADNFARYDQLVSLFASADVAAIAETYRRFYPLFQQAYERLGYPDAYFNDRVVDVIDHLLATPTPDGPIRIVRPHVLYEFADPALEALSSGQKLLLRTGPLHAATIKRALQELRAHIAHPPE